MRYQCKGSAGRKTRKTYDDGLGAAVGVRICSLLIYVDFYMKCMTVCKGEDQQGEDSHHSISTRVIRRQKTDVLVSQNTRVCKLAWQTPPSIIRGNSRKLQNPGFARKGMRESFHPGILRRGMKPSNGFRSIMMSKNQTLLFIKRNAHIRTSADFYIYLIFIHYT